MIVHIEEHLRIAQTCSLHKVALELSELVFTSRRARVEHKYDTMGSFLDRTPASFIAPIARDIPQLNMHLAQEPGRSRHVLLEFDYSDADCRSVIS